MLKNLELISAYYKYSDKAKIFTSMDAIDFF